MFTCGLICGKLFRPEPASTEDGDDGDFLAVHRRYTEDVELSFETAHITRDSLRCRDTSEESSDDEDDYDVYMMSSSDSLTSSGKGGTDDNSDSNTSEDIPDKDENEASASKDDSGKTNAEDKPQSSLEKNGDN